LTDIREKVAAREEKKVKAVLTIQRILRAKIKDFYNTVRELLNGIGEDRRKSGFVDSVALDVVR
jgi:hypothetical protein